MKRLVSIIISTLIINSAGAQTLSIGLKGGLNTWLAIGQGKRGILKQPKDGKTLTNNYELFGRYEFKRNFAVEISASYTKRAINSYGRWSMFAFEPTSYDSSYTESASQYIDANISLQYRISLPYQEKCPLLSKFSNYIGLIASPGIINTKSEVLRLSRFDPSVTPYTDYYSNRYFDLSIGLSHTLKYEVMKDLNIISTLNLKVSTYNRYAPGYPAANGRLQWGIGASYNL